jgi:hypothetical protein
MLSVQLEGSQPSRDVKLKGVKRGSRGSLVVPFEARKGLTARSAADGGEEDSDG